MHCQAHERRRPCSGSLRAPAGRLPCSWCHGEGAQIVHDGTHMPAKVHKRILASVNAPMFPNAHARHDDLYNWACEDQGRVKTSGMSN